MKTLITKTLACLLVVGYISTAAHADDKKDFAKKHPRRAEVLGRANNEKAKNANAAANGQITKAQENKLNREDQKIKRQEQRDARANGGTITKAEQNQLNREENGVNKQRSNMEARDAAKNGAAPAAPAAPTTTN